MPCKMKDDAVRRGRFAAYARKRGRDPEQLFREMAQTMTDEQIGDAACISPSWAQKLRWKLGIRRADTALSRNALVSEAAQRQIPLRKFLVDLAKKHGSGRDVCKVKHIDVSVLLYAQRKANVCLDPRWYIQGEDGFWLEPRHVLPGLRAAGLKFPSHAAIAGRAHWRKISLAQMVAVLAAEQGVELTVASGIGLDLDKVGHRRSLV